jgi:hypothetical protein
MRSVLIGLIALAAITIAGCGSGSSTPTPTPSTPGGTTAHTTPTSVFKVTPGNNPP